MHRSQLLAVVAVACLVGGCATAPDVNMSYAIPKARTTVTVTQTIGCSDKNYVLSVASGTITTIYVADYEGPRGSVNFHAPDSQFVDTDTAVNLSDDGRLTSINAAYVGEGAAAVKSLVALAGTFVTGGARSAMLPGPNPDFCAKLALHAAPKPAAAGGAGGPPPGNAPTTVTLSYTNQFDFVQQGTSASFTDQFGKIYPFTIPAGGAVAQANLDLPPDANSLPIVNDLGPDLLTFGVVASAERGGPTQPDSTGSSDKNVVMVPKLRVVNFALQGPVGDLSKRVASTNAQAVAPTRDLVPVPIGKSEPFGKITTTLAVAGSGLVTKLEYNKGSGAADLVTAASQVAAQAHPQPPTATQQAADVQGEADLIYEQHRLVVCQASAVNCPSK